MTEDTPSWLALIPVIFTSPCLLLWKERTFTKQTLENIPFPPVAPYADSMKADGTRHRLSCYPVFPNAACPRRLCQPPWTQLSLSETRHLSGGPPYAEAHKPNASRSSGERVWGRGASLREAASPPESPQLPASLREGARGRGLLYREASSLAKPLRPHFFREPGFFDAALQPVAAEVVDDEEQGRDRPRDGIAEEHEINVVVIRRDKLHPNDAQ